MKNNLNVFWDIEATKHLREIYKYIKKSSPEGAKKVRDEIFDVIKKLPANPEMFPVDDLKENNDGNYRVVYIYSYRIVYKITPDSIFILVSGIRAENLNRIKNRIFIQIPNYIFTIFFSVIPSTD